MNDACAKSRSSSAARISRIATFEKLPDLTEEDIDDLDDAPDAEVEQTEETVVDQATAARTIAELQAEIEILKSLEALALKVRRSGTDKKWEELSSLLQNHAEMFDAHGHRRKMVIFTEHRDTLNYLTERLRALLGAPEALVTVHGGMGREERTKAQEAFKQDKDVLILLATDAAGEGINLQRAHLMVNYDLPWNPNRLEQRFGRIHRIGQTEVCHLWNLLAEETREGDVYKRLLEKIEQEREALGGGVFDILGQLFREQRLRDLLIEAIRYGDRPEVKARLHQIVDNLTDRKHCQELLEERALANDSMDASQVRKIREDMERAEAQTSPATLHRIVFPGGIPRPRRLHQGTRATPLRDHSRPGVDPPDGTVSSESVSQSWASMSGSPSKSRSARFPANRWRLSYVLGSLFSPRPSISILERNRDLLKRGTVLVDPDDPGRRRSGRSSIWSTPFRTDGLTRPATAASSPGNCSSLRRIPPARRGTPAMPPTWTIGHNARRARSDLDGNAGIASLAEGRPGIGGRRPCDRRPGSEAYSRGSRTRREDLVTRTMAAVKDRLTKEINYWDHRANQLKDQELAGKTNAKINSGKARQRADELQARLQRRMVELELERQISPLPPVAIGGSLVVPDWTSQISSNRHLGGRQTTATLYRRKRGRRWSCLPCRMVMEAERRLGNEPRDVSGEKCGYDIESRVPRDGKLRFIEVKGRVAGALTVTVTRNEILTALNKPEDFILAVGQVENGQGKLLYIRQPFQQEPEFAVESINYKLPELLRQRNVSSMIPPSASDVLDLRSAALIWCRR